MWTMSGPNKMFRDRTEVMLDRGDPGTGLGAVITLIIKVNKVYVQTEIRRDIIKSLGLYCVLHLWAGESIAVLLQHLLKFRHLRLI